MTVLYTKLVRDMVDTKEALERLKMERETQVTVQDIEKSGKHPLSILEQYLYKWPPCDVRREIKFPISINPYEKTSTLEDIVKSAEYVTTKRDLTNNILELSVYYIQNLDEIERYNKVVKKHNDEWEKKGRPLKSFDPVHGIERELPDKYVDPIFIIDQIVDIPQDLIQDISNGYLANSRPEVKRKLLVKIIYQLEITELKDFILSYVVYNSGGEILYYNKISYYNLAYLVKRSVQEIWGLPEESGDYLEGVSYLLTGRKIEICERDNKVPKQLIKPKSSLKSPEEYYKVDSEIRTSRSIIEICTSLVPFGGIIGSIVVLIWCFFSFGSDLTFQSMVGDTPGLIIWILESLFSPYSIAMFLIGAILILNRKFLLYKAREVSVLESEKHFL